MFARTIATITQQHHQDEEHLKPWINPHQLKCLKWHMVQRRTVVVTENLEGKQIIKTHHDPPVHGHPGISKTVQLVEHNYWWPQMHAKTLQIMYKDVLTVNTTRSTTDLQRHHSDPFTQTLKLCLLKLLLWTLSLNFPSHRDMIPFSPSQIMIAQRPQYSYHAEKKSMQKEQQHFTSNMCLHTLDCHRKSSVTETHIHIKVHAGSMLHHRNRTQSLYSISPKNQWTIRMLKSMGRRLPSFISDYHQTNWAPYLPIAQFAHNNWPSDTTQKSPFFLLMGYNPHADWISAPSPLPQVTLCLEQLKQAREYGTTTHDQGTTVMGQTP
jgi:hypothetical protein